MKVRITSSFKQRWLQLRPTQRRHLKEVAENLAKHPELGTPGKEELENYSYYYYEDDYGKNLLTFRIVGNQFWLTSLSTISIKI